MDEIKDDAVKWTLGNDATQRRATMDTLTLVFPAAYGLIKEVKLDGGVFKSKDSSTYPNGVPSGQVIGPNDWTKDETKKRQLDPGEKRTLEIKFTEKFKGNSQGDYTISVEFDNGQVLNFP